MTDWLGPQAMSALMLSLQVATCATLGALPFAVLIGLILARTRFPGHGLLNLIVHMPLVLPPVVTGYVLLILFGRTGPIGATLADWGIVLAFRWTGAAVAAAVMAFPLMVRAIRLSIEAVDPGLEQAAATLGAGRWRIFATVTLPLALPGVVAAALLGFAKAIGEFGATITFVSNIPGQTQTLPTAIYVLLQAPGAEAQVARLVSLSIAVAVVALGLSEWLSRRTAAYVGRRVRDD